MWDKVKKGIGLTAAAASVIAAIASAYATYMSYRLQQNLATAATSSAATIELTGAHADDGCPAVEQKGGKFRGEAHMQRREDLWIVIDSPGTGQFFFVSRTPVTIKDSKWEQNVTVIGDAQSMGSEFQILAVSADANTNAYFYRTVNSRDKSPHVAAFPPGSAVIARQCVKRV